MAGYKYVETEMIRVMAGIMATGQGPWTKMMLVEILVIVYPERSIQELKNEISGAIMTDKYCNKRFVAIKKGWYDLAKKESPDSYRSGPE